MTTTREALDACIDFIENVGPDDPDRTSKFFAVREKWRNATWPERQTAVDCIREAAGQLDTFGEPGSGDHLRDVADRVEALEGAIVGLLNAPSMNEDAAEEGDIEAIRTAYAALGSRT